MKKIIFFALVLISHLAAAQKFSIKGQLTDSLSNSLPAATVFILQAKDSSLVNFSVSDLNGFFELKSITRGDYFFKVSYIGFGTYMKRVNPAAGVLEVNLGQIKLYPKSKLLNEVLIQAEKAPVVVKRDTIEFNAGSFKVKVNATAEDLIKKLPSIEVDNDGTIRAQGETVQRVMVDGKEFFGQDPKLATRNLPADAVEKVQVYDKKSDQTIFSGIDDGQREKTINLELKEEKRHATFGNDMAAGGTDGRFDAKASLNRFDKGNQLSFLGMGNNINQQGFSIGDYANFGGTGGGAGGTGATVNNGRQNGIVTNYAAGVNTNDNYNNNKTKVNASYFYNYLNQDLTTLLHRINYLPTGSYNFDQHSQQTTTNNNHRVNVTVDHRIDSANSVKFNVNASYNIQSQPVTNLGTTDNIGDVTQANSNVQNTTNNTNGVTMTSYMLLRHRFRKKGRTISSNITFNYTNNGGTGSNISTNNFFTYPGGVKKDSMASVNQVNTQKTISPTYGVTTSYTEPLGGRKYLEFNYNFSTDINRVEKLVYDVKNEQQTLDTVYSNKYNSNYLYSRPGMNFRLNRDKFNLTFGTGFQQTWLKGSLLLTGQHIDRLFQAVVPVVHFNYDFSNFERLRFDYTTSMQEPTITQLSPVVNNNDQLNLSTGNYKLKPAYSQSIRSNFTLFDPSSFLNFFALINANYTTNAIVSSQSTSPQFVRTTKPVNVKSGSSASGNFNVGIPLKVINSRFNIGPNYSISRTINLTNNLDNIGIQQTLGSTARYNYSLKDILIVDLSANFSHQDTKYSLNKAQNSVFYNKTYTAETNVNFLKNYSFNTEMDYFIYTSATTHFYQTIPLWTASVSRYVLRNKAGEIKFIVNNILNRSLSVQQTASSNYLQQQTMNNLGRFYMISLTYALNKQLNPMNGAGGNRRFGGGGGGGNRTFNRQ